MKRSTRQRYLHRLLMAGATLPLLASTCTERTLDYVFGSDFFDNRSNADKAEDIINEIGDLFDDIF